MAETPPGGATGADGCVPGVVLDTNAVLDWLVFKDGSMGDWSRQIEAGAVRWWACPPMRTELERMLGHRSLARWAPDAASVLAHFDRWTQPCATPPASAAPRWRCSDPDDQVFLDLALAQGARWLVSHDRALLRLARKLRPHGLQITPPGLALQRAAGTARSAAVEPAAPDAAGRLA